MERFKLNQMPKDYQLSIRLNNLIAFYGVKRVKEMIEDLIAMPSSFDAFNNDAFIRPSRNEMNNAENGIGLYINSVQILKHFGTGFVVQYWNAIYSEKVA